MKEVVSSRLVAEDGIILTGKSIDLLAKVTTRSSILKVWTSSSNLIAEFNIFFSAKKRRILQSSIFTPVDAISPLETPGSVSIRGGRSNRKVFGVSIRDEIVIKDAVFNLSISHTDGPS